MQNITHTLTISLCLTLALVCPTHAQPLADRLPASSLVYIGWAGVDDMGPGYKGSRFEAILETSGIKDMVAIGIDTARQNMAQNQGDDGQREFEAGLRVAALTWRKPFAYALLDIQPPADGNNAASDEPTMTSVCVWNAGDESDILINALQTLVDLNDEPQTHLAIVREQGLVVLTINLPEGQTGLTADVKNSIMQTARFKDALKTVGSDSPSLVAYSDASVILGKARMFALTRGPEESEKVNRTITALGMDTVGRAVYVGQFAGREWATRAWLEAPAPRKGLLALLDQGPADPNILKETPRTADWAATMRIDPATVLQTIQKIADEIDENDGKEMREGLTQAKEELGFDIEKDLLASFGQNWLLFGDPSVAGPGGLGMCVVNPARNDDKLMDCLLKLEALLNKNMADDGPRNPMSRGFTTVNLSGVEVHTMSLFIVSPSWAMHNNRFYLGLFPQAVTSATIFADPNQPSILDHPDYAPTVARLTDTPATYNLFVDLKLTAPQSYQMLMMLSNMIASAAPDAGVQKIMAALPPLGKIMPHLSPIGQKLYVDGTGCHYESINPFPGANILAPNATINSMPTTAMAVGILLPAMGAARQAARQTVAANNARQIIMGVILYATDFEDKLPESLSRIVEGGYITIDPFTTPADGNKIPQDVRNAPLPEQAKWVEAHGSFVMVPGYKTMNDLKGDTVLIFEKYAQRKRTIAVGFGDGHVEQLEKDEARRVIEASAGKTVEQLGGVWGEQDPDQPASAP
ncbi:MAG: hypothetical protein GC164_07875 [Phycisphaera sp.]|nr:hypothetical protein [Phycisphaera sp.]